MFELPSESDEAFYMMDEVLLVFGDIPIKVY